MALGLVDLGGGQWGIEETEAPDGHIIALGQSQYAIDPDASSGATITEDSGSYYFEISSTGTTHGSGHRPRPSQRRGGRRRYFITYIYDAEGRVIGFVTNSPVI